MREILEYGLHHAGNAYKHSADAEMKTGGISETAIKTNIQRG